MKVEQEPEGAPGVERLLALSDGVVAIALTLLVLSLHVPALPSHGADANSASWLWHQLNALTDPLISYLVSFYVIAQFWLAHHRTFRLMKGHDEGLAWWNFLFLLAITLLPFTSNLLGQYAENPLAIDIFGLNLVIASLSTLIVISVAQRKGLVVSWADPVAIRAGRVRALSIVAIVGISMGLAWSAPNAAKYMWFLIALVPRVLNRYVDRRWPIEGGTGVEPSASASG